MMRYLLTITFCLTPYPVWAACTGSSPTWTSTVDRTAVASCVSQASVGDVINVSAGAATWSASVTLDQLSLIGAGAGSTTLANSLGSSIIIMAPTSNSNITRVSGFTIDVNAQTNGGGGVGIKITNGQQNPYMYNIRVDNNTFTSVSAEAFDSGAAIQNWGAAGVIDNNTFTSIYYPLRIGWGDEGTGGKLMWDEFSPLVYGAANGNIYFEDNTVTLPDNPSDSNYAGVLTDGGEGGRYVVRYNDIDNSEGVMVDTTLDLHNWQATTDHATLGGEVYGNDLNYGASGDYLMKWRGGRLLQIFNNITTTGTTPGTSLYNNNGSCPTGTYELIELHNNGVILENRKNNTGSLFDVDIGAENCGLIEADTDYWVDNTTESGSSQTTGVRCGSDRTAVTTCTEDVFFWETDQSCSDVSNMVGVSPTTPIAGTLYRCNASNTWVSYYTPYTYPHPLRGASASAHSVFKGGSFKGGSMK